ncbi:MAG TPA: hypothetical protein VLM79_29360 [Kofleriaceae bacterium]|nr:hypothetical protein [Kofleriaceae bacterium]
MWRPGAAAIVGFVGLAACRFPDETGARYACDADGACPAGLSCVDDVCVPERGTCAVAVAVTAGDRHTCALRDDGTAWCWGRNFSGELGDGTTDDHTAPVQVMGPTRFAAIAAGIDHTCALTQEGTVWCWGSNASGQRGGTVNGGGPAQVAGLGRVTAIAAGNAHSCALLDGTVWCWGANGSGQLGIGTRSPSRSPVSVSLGNVQEIAVRGDTTCAIDRGGALSCWGDNSGGQLGDGTTQSRSMPTPIVLHEPIAQVAQVAHVALGDQSVCALTTSGAVYCLGLPYANPGDPPGTPRHIDVPVAAASITSGGRFACATAAGEGDARSVWCWGADESEQLADGAFDAHLTPLVSAHTGVLAGGHSHLCSLSAGSISCSGDNAFGQLGNGHRTTQGKPPAPIAGLEGITSIAAGGGHSCAVTGGAGGVSCWGRNGFGQIGDGTNDDRSRPTRVAGVDHAREVVAGVDHSCALLEDQTARCWGVNGRGQVGAGTKADRELPRAVGPAGAPLGGIAKLVAGGQHTCALLDDRTVRCWGAGGVGQLGNGETVDSPVPVQVVGLMGVGNLSGVVEVAVGDRHTCAILAAPTVEEQTIACWGYNIDGELGDGTTSNKPEPVPVVGLKGIVHIRARGDFSCALDTHGIVTCWGFPQDGQLGNGDTTVHAKPGASVGEVVGATQIMAGGSHACALSGGALKCWGASYAGQVGTGDYSRVIVPVAVSLSGVASLAGGTNHTCALLEGGRVTCWGEDRTGQLGDGSFDPHAPVATELPCP